MHIECRLFAIINIVRTIGADQQTSTSLGQFQVQIFQRGLHGFVIREGEILHVNGRRFIVRGQLG